VILQLDWCVGELMTMLERHGLARDTMVIFTSDNGPVVDDGYQDEAKEKLGEHKPSGPWRGGKYSILEGGTRVPWIVRWPARVKAGESSALMCQVDFPATFAAIAGTKFEAESAPDAQNMMAALLGEAQEGRANLIEHAGGGLAVRAGDWKFIPKRPGPARMENTDTETGNSPEVQLYNLKTDPRETKNVAAENPTRVEELRKLLESERAK
jgi:arylsulfatase A-like enzyme